MSRPSPPPFNEYARDRKSPRARGSLSPEEEEGKGPILVDVGEGTQFRQAETCPRCQLPLSHTPFCTATGLPHSGCKKCGLDVKKHRYCMVSGKPHFQSDLKYLPHPARTATKRHPVPHASKSDRNDARSELLMGRSVQLMIAGPVKDAFTRAVAELCDADVSAMPYPKQWRDCARVPKLRRC
eukprot:TRINITY_DN10896_c0_g1_i1.p1 TRINITY_DN10896_c0_g1~~TRINITY_DN10896_c0_g1_i1.p1  ORF type:complete len:183 (+),score=33.63 TRINITY_DN10896_c0_g1_i1:194-742(+)